MSILLKKIRKKFGQFFALQDINLEIPEGELVALLGSSGCGKATESSNCRRKGQTMNKKTMYLKVLFWIIFINPIVAFAGLYTAINAEKGELIVRNGSKETRIQIMGNSIVDSYSHNEFQYIELHVNPSLSELVKFNIQTNQNELFQFTQYKINDYDDVLVELDPPHSSESETIQIVVNDKPLYEGKPIKFDRIISKHKNFFLLIGKKLLLK